ncbi:hypothetical protein ACOJBO_03835 [Rhizobium beringeri]
MRRDKVNYDYGFKGSDAAKPLWVVRRRIEDLHGNSPAMPAIFIVDNKRRESLVNYRREADYIVIDTVRGRTLRYGTENETCLFNLRTAPAGYRRRSRERWCPAARLGRRHFSPRSK